MMTSRQIHWLIGGGAALLLLRAAAQIYVPLMPQEAYYWMYSQHLSMSYYDHPPMVAWIIRLGTLLFGNTEWGVRSVSGALALVNALLMYHFARQWWSRGVALVSAAFIEITPIYLGFGFVGTMDSALLFFWLLALVGLSAALLRQSVWGWYVCGFGLGGALLSKYTGIFLVPGVGLLLLTHRPWRKYLVSPHPYLAVSLGLAMFWPVLLWNWRHDWISFRFQFTDRFDIGVSAHHHSLLEFLGEQIGVATPLVIVAFAAVIWRAVRRRRLSGREKLALAFSLPLLLIVSKKAWAYPTHIDWTAPAYLSFIPAAWQAARVRARARRRPAWLWPRAVARPTLAICALCSAVMLSFLLVRPWRARLIHVFGPWDQLASVVEEYENDLEAKSGREPLIIANGKYALASELAFYRNRIVPDETPAGSTTSQFALGDEGLGYAYWDDPGAWLGRDCLYVDESVEADAQIIGRFKSSSTVWTGKASNGRPYRVIECYGYLGSGKMSPGR